MTVYSIARILFYSLHFLIYMMFFVIVDDILTRFNNAVSLLRLGNLMDFPISSSYLADVFRKVCNFESLVPSMFWMEKISILNQISYLCLTWKVA